MRTSRNFKRFAGAAGLALCAGAACLALGGSQSVVRAADHADATLVGNDAGADVADVYMFLDPTDNTKVVIVGTFHGFIVPAEANNMGAFDPLVRYRFEIENTGDGKSDTFMEFTFTERPGSGQPQTATIRLPNGKKFTAPTTAPTLASAPLPQTVTTDPASGVQFFGGIVDDPFFFDIPAFGRFIKSVTSGAPDTSVFNRARSSFSGYNIMAIAVSVPAALIRGKADNNVVGVSFSTFRQVQTPTKSGTVKLKGPLVRVDRIGIPAVNTALIPFKLKNAYNAASPTDDAKGKFAADIAQTLTVLGTNEANTGVLAGAAILKGDYVRVDLSVANTGPGGGNNSGAGFPNGRRLQDDVIDTILTIVANGTPVSDHVDGNDVPFQDVFPFVGLPQQPRDNGVVDDNTRN
jgi:hypothetical protein